MGTGCSIVFRVRSSRTLELRPKRVFFRLYKRTGRQARQTMGSNVSSMVYEISCEVAPTNPDQDHITCDLEVRVHCANGTLKTLLFYGMRGKQEYRQSLQNVDIGTAQYVECAVRRGAPSARGTVKSTPVPFNILDLTVRETRGGHLHETTFRREAAINLGDSLCLSILLAPSQQHAAAAQAPVLSTIPEDQAVGDVSGCEAV